MIKIILFFFQLVITSSSEEKNFSNINEFINKLSNYSFNLSLAYKEQAIINSNDYCVNYDYFNHICLECEEGYSLLNGECVCYDRNCKNCKSSLYGGCTECHSGYALSTDNTCRCNIPHCLLCDDDKCNVCEKGYSLTESGTACEFNYIYKNNGYCTDVNCDICTINIDGACIKCKDGYNLENGNCTINPSMGKYFKGNILCPEDYISAGKGCNKLCLGAACPPGNPHYMVCDNKCIYCKEGVLYESLNCNMSTYCFDKKCTKCRTDEIGMCDRCEIGYKLLYGRCEEKCKDENCLNCDYTADGSCNWCKYGYALINGRCYPKNEGYSKSELYLIYEDKIKDYAKQFNITYLGEGKLEVFNENNASIIFDYNDLITRFHSNKFNEICEVENCNSCISNFSNYCNSCLSDYTAVNGECIKCEISQCSLCLSENECNRCEEGFILINNHCINNSGTTPFCLKYKNNICIQCEDNYILNEGKCNLNTIYTQNTLYDRLSCTDDTIRNEICMDHYYYKDYNCSICYDPKCFFCSDGIGCIICEKGYNLIDGRCLKKAEFNETIENCISYDYDGKCIGCDSFCILREEKCNCKIVSDIVVYLLIVILAIIIAAIALIIFKQRLSMAKIEKLSENNMKLIEDNKITDQEMALLQENDKKLKKCFYCKKEIALFKLSCACLFCKEDFKDIFEGLTKSITTKNDNSNINNDNNNIIPMINKNREKFSWKDKNILDNLLNTSSLSKIKKGKCPCCHRDFDNYKQIAQQCDICFDITSKIFHFKCGCALSVCKICFNKIIVGKKCPVCRKNILEAK